MSANRGDNDNKAEARFVEKLQLVIEESWLSESDYSANNTANSTVKNTSNKHVWFGALRRLGWLGIDWPTEHGGTGWSKREQWLWLKVTSEHLCPLPDDYFTVLAPLIIGAGSDNQRERYLPDILAGTADWSLALNPPNPIEAVPTRAGWTLKGHQPTGAASHLCLLVNETLPGAGGHILILNQTDLARWRQHGNQVHINESALLGVRGQGFNYLIDYQSPLLNLTMLNQTICYIERIQAATDDGSEGLNSALVQLKIEADATQAMFLLDADQQHINLRFSMISTTATELLADALGYYALPAPDLMLSSNEPDLPFEAERHHLVYLNQQLARDIMLQKSMLFDEISREA